MAVSEYKKRQIYQVGQLKPHILILPVETTLIDYSIDNGECRVKAIRCTNVYKIEGLGASYSSSETLEGRFKFSNTLTVNVPEINGNTHFSEIAQILKGNYYTIFETNNGDFFMESVDYPVEITYSYSFTNNSVSANVCALSFNSYSNIPTMSIAKEKVPAVTQTIINSDCKYNVGRVKRLRMCNYKNVLVSQNRNGFFDELSVNGNQSFVDIDFNTSSFSFTETYDESVFKQTITFTIPLSEYKYYWHYNLIEFTNNRYVCIIDTECGNTIISGFDFGFTPTYTIASAEASTSMDTITITLKHIGDCISASNTEENVIINEDKLIMLSPVNEYTDENGNLNLTTVCINETTGVRTLFEEVTSTGGHTGKYHCLVGYEDIYSNLNIVGTYNEDDEIGYPIKFNSSECALHQGCQLLQTPSSIVNFTRLGESHTYNISGECNWRLEDVPSWLTIQPNEGSANEIVSVNMTTAAEPTEEGQTAIIKIVSSNGSYGTFNVNYKAIRSFIIPTEFSITAQAQTVACNIVNYNKNNPFYIVEGMSSTSGLVGWQRQGAKIKMDISENKDYVNQRVITAVAQSKQGERVTITITQDKLYRRLVSTNEYLCDGNNSYRKMQVYKGYTSDNCNIPTDVYEKGDLILENDTRCTTSKTEWRVTDETICNGSTEYRQEAEYVTHDNGITWTATGEVRTGALVEELSPNCDSRYQWVDNGNNVCINGNLYQQLAKTFTGTDGNPTYTGDVKIGNLIEAQSSQCVGAEEALISWDYTDSNYEANTNVWLCNVKSQNEFTVNFGDGNTKRYNSGEATNGVSIRHNWGGNTTQNHTIQIYGRINSLEIVSSEYITGLNVEKGGTLKELVINPNVGNEYNSKVSIKDINLSNCVNLKSFRLYKHTGANGIESFTFPTSGSLEELVINEGDETRECYITDEQIQNIIDSAVAVSQSGHAGIMSFCSLFYRSEGETESHLTACGKNISSLAAKKWLYNSPCCEVEGSKKYQIISNGETICDSASFNKLEVRVIQESTYTNGAWSNWANTDYRITGNVVEYNSRDCGFVPSIEYEWRLSNTEFVCDGYNSYWANVKYQSTDGGNTWTQCVPLETQNSGTLKKQNDEDCGWIRPETYRERWVVVPDEYICQDGGGGEYNPCGFHMLWTPFGFENGKFKGLESTATALPEICDGDTFTTINGMFKDMQNLQLFPVFNVSNVQTAREAFMNCVQLDSTEEYPSSQYDFSSLTDATSMFENCGARTLKLNMPALSKADYMFRNCPNLETIEFLKCGEITSFSNWFYNIPSLRTIKGINAGGLTGEQNISGGNYNMGHITTLYVDYVNCIFHVDAFPNIGSDSIETIIQHCVPGENTKLIFSNEQFNSKVSQEMIDWMTNHGIHYELTGN